MIKKISIVTPCYNESENIEDLVHSVRKIFFDKLKNYEFEHIIIDNNSNDGSKDILRRLAKNFNNLKLIFNTRNFGHIQSPHHARLQATGDAVVNLAADFQDPPEVIETFVKEWEKGSKIVLGIKSDQTNENIILRSIRNFYYRLVLKISDVEMHNNFSSYCIIDKVVMNKIREYDDTYPYFRGLISSLGYKVKKIKYDKNKRNKGITKNNFYTLYDIGVLGLTRYSKIPLRLCIFFGFFLTMISLTTGIFYTIYKIIFWEDFFSGFTPLVILFSFLVSFILFFMGVIGEYILMLSSKFNTLKVVEEERINFE